MSTRLVAVLAAFVVGLAMAPADASARHRHHKHHRHHKPRPQPPPAPTPPPATKPASFDGSCTFSGAVKFTPPMTSTAQPVAQHADAPGTCTGRFVDQFGGTHELDNAATRYQADSSGDQVSCEFGLAAGSGALVFPDGQIPFTMHEYRAGATPMIRLDGKTSGGAWMPVTPSQGSDPAAAVQACNGAGLSEFDLDAHLQTDSPITG
jgi:hypothetical protein